MSREIRCRHCGEDVSEYFSCLPHCHGEAVAEEQQRIQEHRQLGERRGVARLAAQLGVDVQFDNQVAGRHHFILPVGGLRLLLEELQSLRTRGTGTQTAMTEPEPDKAMIQAAVKDDLLP